MSTTIVGHLLRSIGGATAEGEEAPNAPSLSIANDGTGTSVTATVAGDDGVTNTLYYRDMDDAAWTEGNHRTGDGTIAQDGLIADTWYWFMAVSTLAGEDSLSSIPRGCYVTASEDDTQNIFWGPLENLRDLVARSNTWQTWIGAEGTESERIAIAKTHIHIPRIHVAAGSDPNAAAKAARPFAIIDMGEDWSETNTASGDSYLPGGNLFLSFEADAVGDTAEAAHKSFMVNAGNVIRDMETGQGEGRFIMASAQLIDGPHPPGEEESIGEGAFYFAVYQIERGI